MTTHTSSSPKVTDLELLVKFYQSLSLPDQARLCRLLQWALALPASQSANVKVVSAYTNQPPGYNDVSTLLIARLQKNGNAIPNAWVLRIPLRCDANHPLTVTLPSWHKASTVQEAEIARGTDDNFRPLDLDDFLNRPNYYVMV